MDLPSRHVLYLSKKVGMRAAGSDGEAAAASYVLRTMDDMDIEVDMETFSSWKSDFHGLLLIYMLAIAAYLLYPLSYTLSIFMSVFVFLVFQMETYSWSVVSKLLPRSSTSNIVGRVRPEADTRNRVVLVANYDSARTSPLGRPRIARAYRFLYIISFICILLIVILGIFGLGASLAKVKRHVLFQVWLFSAAFPFYILLFFLSIFWGEAFGRQSPGANDNAAGVGVMLSVLSSLAGNPLEHTDVWGVATARGFAGGRGMIALLRRHRRQLRDAYIINIDHPGTGQTKIISLEGVMLGFRSSHRLKRLALKAAKRSKGLEVGKGRCRVKKSDAMVALARGRRAISIGGTVGGTYQGWRNRDDVYDKVERKSLDNALKLVQLLLDEIDEASVATRRSPDR